MKTIGIIGAGPAGIMAAIRAAGTHDRVVLVESNSKIGRKLLVTGSGRCNLTNMNLVTSRYSSADSRFVEEVIERVSPKILLSELKSLGIPTFSTPDGWCYPLSESAANVVNLLQAEISNLLIDLHLNTKIKTITRLSEQFELADEEGKKITCHQLLVACGGKAHPTLGADGTLFPELKRLGHSVIPLRPALAPLTSPNHPLSGISGVRLDVAARLLKSKKVLGQSTGNLIVTDWGFNGPAVMDLSHLVDGMDCVLELNLLAGKEKPYDELLEQQRTSNMPVEVFLGAFLPSKVPSAVLHSIGVPPNSPLKLLDGNDLSKLKAQLCSLCISISGTRDFEHAQLKVGGIPVTEVNAHTMESRLIPGLYLAGEVLDVVGPCGGYNLHFAFASGMIAGESIHKKTER